MPLSISSTVQSYPTHLPLRKIANTILGDHYTLSLTFVGATRARSLNQRYRHKDYVPNVLSFPLTDTVGEIYLCPAVAQREAAKFDLTPDGYILYLFIHGCLHLKGYDHGPQMDALEAQYRRTFNVQ